MLFLFPLCHSERSEDELLSQRRKISKTSTLCVTEILPPYGRLNDKQNRNNIKKQPL